MGRARLGHPPAGGGDVVVVVVVRRRAVVVVLAADKGASAAAVARAVRRRQVDARVRSAGAPLHHCREARESASLKKCSVGQTSGCA